MSPKRQSRSHLFLFLHLPNDRNVDVKTGRVGVRKPGVSFMNSNNTWTARRPRQSILKEISPGCSLEGLMLKLKLQYFGHLMRRADSLEKTDAGRDWGQEEKGMTEDEIAGWHHQLDRHEFG